MRPYTERLYPLSALSLISAALTALILKRKSFSPGPLENFSPDLFYAGFFLAAVFLGVLILTLSPSLKFRDLIRALLIFSAPTEIVLLTGLSAETHVPVLFFLLRGVWPLTLGLLLIFDRPKETVRLSLGKWLRAQGKGTLSLLVLLAFSFFLIGSRDIGQFAAVDEPLWVHGRIGNFWKNISDRDWSDTAVSDKPGITVALVSGIGLLKEDPQAYKPPTSKRAIKDVAPLNAAMRLPLLALASLAIIFFYFATERFAGKKTALLATATMTFSPILIGMSRIVNPDALLWVFGPLATISFLAYLQKKERFLLYMAGVSMGLALLTKYVSNIIFVFLAAALMLEYIVGKRPEGIRRYLQKAAADYATFVFIALAVFYLLLPATWLEPARLLEATLFSQAFETTWPFFVALILLVAVDHLGGKNRILGTLLDKLAARRYWISSSLATVFLAALLFAIIDVYLGMRPFDFEAILASPKSSFKEAGFAGIFAANFYPLIFGINPLVLLGIFSSSSILLLKNKNELSTKGRAAFYAMLFILFYYLGSSVTEVASTIRYQIMVVPFAFLLGAVGIAALLEKMNAKHFLQGAYLLSLFLGLSAALLHPFYLGYASVLLPSKYALDVKDMGLGSYEAAQYLNSLPQSRDLSVWTDKDGVCDFFGGNCYSFNDSTSFLSTHIDYFVISSGRKSRSLGIFSSRHSNPYDFAKIYATEKYEKQFIIGGRPSNHVRIIPNSPDLKK